MNVSAIIFSNIYDNSLFELTHFRSTGSIPIGCRYRLVDFALSNMVNSNITDINIITHYNYHSLMDHIGSGKDWDLARRSGGIKFLPPFITAYANNDRGLYTTRLEALINAEPTIMNLKSDYVVLSDCNIICNVDLDEMIEQHISTGADATFAVKRIKAEPNMAKHNKFVVTDENDKIKEFIYAPVDYSDESDVELNITVINKKYLQEIVREASSHHYRNLTRDVFMQHISRRNLYCYRYTGQYAFITSFNDYFNTSMKLISDKDFFNSIFNNEERPIYTKVRNSAPTYYGKNSFVKNSLIADGCKIEGCVENSILFRGVKVGKDAVIMNSILFQDTYTGENVTLQYVVADKNVVIRDGVAISGHSTMPVHIEKGKMI